MDVCYQMRKRGVTVYAYANNHYSGHAPGDNRAVPEFMAGKKISGARETATIAP